MCWWQTVLVVWAVLALICGPLIGLLLHYCGRDDYRSQPVEAGFVYRSQHVKEG